MCLEKLLDANSKCILEKLFTAFEEELYENSEANKKLAKEILKEEEAFYNKLTEEQVQTFEKLCELKDLNDFETDKNIFVYAFSLAIKLMMECIH